MQKSLCTTGREKSNHRRYFQGEDGRLVEPGGGEDSCFLLLGKEVVMGGTIFHIASFGKEGGKGREATSGKEIVGRSLLIAHLGKREGASGLTILCEGSQVKMKYAKA